MEKIISDMSKHKQLIKQLILFVPQKEIALKLTFTENVIYFLLQYIGFSWFLEFFFLFKDNYFGEKKKKQIM